MESLKEALKGKYYENQARLEADYNRSMENTTFKKVVSTLKCSKYEIMKHTTKIEDTVRELDNCRNCKNILECRNTVCGHVYYPILENDNIVFCYLPCQYKKELDKKNAYQQNISIYDMPKEIKNASMKEIYTDDAARFDVIKWLNKYIDNYKKGIYQKGLYLTGNFGSGKTYLISAMLNELAKNNAKVAIVYYPEFLRSLKESFYDDGYNQKFNYIKKVEILLLDDIGAEVNTQWARDEVLGTILQYRMQEGLRTFFTSNFTLKELEEHLSLTTKSDEKVKARRIIERIKQLTETMTMISENKRK